MSTLAKVILGGVHNDGTAMGRVRVSRRLLFGRAVLYLPDDRVGANELDVLVRDLQSGVTILVSDNVAEVTNVTFSILGSTVGLAEGVEMSTSRSAA